MSGRILPVVYNDRESETRTPAQPLYVIPPDAGDGFTPFAPIPPVGAAEADLSRISRGMPVAAGQAIDISGRVLDEGGRPVCNALIEVWNANTYGRYSHVMDSQIGAPLDPDFYGFGRLITGNDGHYRLRTIKPGAYIARPDIGWWRPPHVHLSILGSGVRLVTQMYFPGDPLNLKDCIHMTIPESQRERSIARPIAESAFRFDIVVRGRCQTPPDSD